MKTIEDKYQELMATPSDVNLLFPLIRGAISPGDRVVELGVRDCVSTWALLAGKPSYMASVDINFPPETNVIEAGLAAQEEGIIWRFVQGDSTQVLFSDIDVLFIDTLHLYSHVMKELWRHSPRVKKRIIFHDWLIPEVRSCVQDFLYNTDWKLEVESDLCNGLAIVKRI